MDKQTRMISHKYRCIFVHIPKTAGQSIERFFLEMHGLSWDERSDLLLRHNAYSDRGPERLAHLTASEYTGLGYVTKDQFDRYFKFCFVRNPWDRLVSEFKYRGYGRDLSFRDFVHTSLGEHSDTYSDAIRHLIPQSEYVFNAVGSQLCDFVGYFEDLQTDFDRVCTTLKVGPSRLRRTNSSSRMDQILQALKLRRPGKHRVTRAYRSFYDKETAQIVGAVYERDVSAFGYSF